MPRGLSVRPFGTRRQRFGDVVQSVVGSAVDLAAEAIDIGTNRDARRHGQASIVWDAGHGVQTCKLVRQGTFLGVTREHQVIGTPMVRIRQLPHTEVFIVTAPNGGDMVRDAEGNLFFSREAARTMAESIARGELPLKADAFTLQTGYGSTWYKTGMADRWMAFDLRWPEYGKPVVTMQVSLKLALCLISIEWGPDANELDLSREVDANIRTCLVDDLAEALNATVKDVMDRVQSLAGDPS